MEDPKVLVGRLGALLQEQAPSAALRGALAAAQAQLVAAIANAQAAGTPGEILAAQAAYAAAAQAWNGARDALTLASPTSLVEPLLALVPLPGLRELLGHVADAGIDQQVRLGPLVVDLELPPVQAIVQMAGAPQPLAPVFLGYQEPESVGLELVLAGLGGGGFLQLEREPARLAGVIELRLGIVDVHAFGILEKTGSGDVSVLVLLGAHFFPGIQLSFGFACGAVGGLVGINRAIDLDVARRRLSDGSITDTLFPDDPVANAPHILDTLAALFPTRAGSFVFGPTFQLNWGQVSPTGPAIAQADLALLMELPGPRRVALVGRIQINLPPGPVALVHLELDVLGTLDTVAALLTIDASLLRSSLLGLFRVTGDAAFRLNWGPRPYFLLSLGGFHPSFTPEPGVGRALARLALALDSPIAGIYLRAEGYFAVTPNTLQFGGRVETGISAAGVEAGGFMALDAIAYFRPFHFSIDYSAGFSVRFEGANLGSISVSGTISGPGPLVISASLSVSVLFFDISWDESFTLPPSVDQPLPTLTLRQAVLSELEKSTNLRAGDNVDPAVRLVASAAKADDPKVALLAPTGTLRWTQSSVPFETTLLRLDGVDLADPGAARLAAADPLALTAGALSREWFSPAGFRKLSSAELLNQPSYAELPSGRAFTLLSASGPARAGKTDFDVFVRRGDQAEAQSSSPRVAHAARLLTLVASRAGAAACTNLSPVVAIDDVVESAWTVAGGGGSALMNSETEAHTQRSLSAPMRQLAVVHESDRIVLGGVL